MRVEQDDLEWRTDAQPEHPWAAHPETEAERISSYLPLVRRVVSQLARRLPANVERDDLLAAGAFGLVESLRRNGGSEGASFEGYARTRIRGAVYDELRAQDWLSQRARRRVIEGDRASTCFVSLDEEPALPHAEDAGELIEARSELRALVAAMRGLPERERLVLCRHYFEGVRFRDIGVELGVSEPRISQIHARALDRLRGVLLRAA